MARRKTLPESVRAKHTLSERLASLRAELFGDRGGPELARRLGLPIRTWYNYEAGVTVPAEVILKIIELTSVEPMWLLHGRGPKFRRPSHESRIENLPGPSASVETLLRTALELLERGEGVGLCSPRLGREPGDWRGGDASVDHDDILIGVTGGEHEPLTNSSGPRYAEARSEWLDAQQENRCIRVTGNDMAPIVADGAYVAFARNEEPPAELDGKIVVAWIDGQPIVRWFHHHGRFAQLHAGGKTEVRFKDIKLQIVTKDEASTSKTEK
jgi:hypothetical protein